MMESTENIDLFVPIVFAILISYVVGGIFTRSIYINSVRFKNIPFLVEHIPHGSHYVKAEDVMRKDVKSFNFRVEVSEVNNALKDTSYNGFPVVSRQKKLMGIISRDYLMVLLKNKCWTSDFRNKELNDTLHPSNRHSLNSDHINDKKLAKMSIDKDSRKKLLLS